MNTTALPALHGITVLELAVDEAGQYAGRQLASLGARVIKIESLEGDEGRGSPPFIHDRAGRRRSVAHEYLNAGKESIALDLDDDFLFALLRRLAATADLLLTGPAHACSLPQDLGIPVFTTGPHGAAGAKARTPSTPFTRFHAGGSGYLIPAERPTAPGTLAGECFAGAGILVGVLGLLLMRRRAGAADTAAPRADHSQQAHAVNLEKMFIGRISKHGVELTRHGHRYPFGGAVRCKDGFVSMLINEKHQWKGFCEAIGRPEWASDPRFATGSDRWTMQDEINGALEPWCAARTRQQVVDAMRARQVPLGSVREVPELIDDPTLRSRGFVRDAETPYGRAAVLGLPYGDDALWQARPRPFAPLLGEHSAALLAELGHSEEEITMLQNLCLVRSEHAAA